jgi:cell division initiation protein
MKISPMDIQRQSFKRKLRGFDRDEVRTYLNIVAEELQELQRDHAQLQQEATRLRDIVEEHRQREVILKNTLLTAQRVSEEIRETARKEATVITKQAELQADHLLELAQKRAGGLDRDIMDLRAQRSALRGDIRGLISRLTQVLDLQEEAELADNLRILKRREETGA